MNAKGLLLLMAVTASTLLRPAKSAPFESWAGHRLAVGEWRDTMIFAKGSFWLRNGSGAGLWRSENGTDWSKVVPGPYSQGGLAFGNDIFVAGAQTTGISISEDGIRWRGVYYSGAWPIQESSIAFGAGVFVTATDTLSQPGGLYWSRNGVEWTNSYRFENKDYMIQSVNFVDDRFLVSALRVRPQRESHVLASSNGIDWNAVRPAAGQTNPIFSGVAYGAGKHVADAGEIVTFTLGEELQTVSRWDPGEKVEDVIYAGGKFVAVGDLIAYSEDGISWQRAAKPKVGTLFEVAHGNGRFAASGSSTFLVSTNGVDWVAHGFALSDVTGLVHADGKFVGTGTKSFEAGSGVIVSTQRGQWKAHDVLPGTNRVTALTHAGGEFFAAAGAKAYKSADAISWQEIDTGFGGQIVALTHFRGRFWGAGSNALGDGVIVEAVPGIDWRIAKTLPKMPLSGIAASSERIVAIGGTNFISGSIFASGDGIDWIEAEQLDFRPYSIAYLANQFMIGGHFAGRAFSRDGISWTQQADGQESLNVIGHTGAAYIAFHAIGSGTRLLVSPNGQSWERRLITTAAGTALPPATAIQLSIGAIGSRRVVVAAGNVLLETDPLVPSFRGIVREGAGLRLQLGENWTGEALEIESSEDLRSWNLVPGLGEGNAVVGEVSGARRFYRVKAE